MNEQAPSPGQSTALTSNRRAVTNDRFWPNVAERIIGAEGPKQSSKEEHHSGILWHDELACRSTGRMSQRGHKLTVSKYGPPQRIAPS